MLFCLIWGILRFLCSIIGPPVALKGGAPSCQAVETPTFAVLVKGMLQPLPPHGCTNERAWAWDNLPHSGPSIVLHLLVACMLSEGNGWPTEQWKPPEAACRVGCHSLSLTQCGLCGKGKPPPLPPPPSYNDSAMKHLALEGCKRSVLCTDLQSYTLCAWDA